MVSVAAGAGHNMAVVETAEGGRELYTWGCGRYGRLGHGNDRSDKLVPTPVARRFLGTGQWARNPESSEAIGNSSADALIIAELRRRVGVLEERGRETSVAMQRLSGATARDMSDDELAAFRDESAAATRRFDLELARRRCKELLEAEVEADDASPFKSFVCPITLSVMDHPVVASDGYSYERSALETHIAGQPTFPSPMTRAMCQSEPLISNNALRSDIQNKLEHMARTEVDGAVGQRRRLE